MDLKLLREATRPEHEATEAAVTLMGPDLTRDEYVGVLQRFHDVICAWETASARRVPPKHTDLLRERRRCKALEDDLRFFGAPVERENPATLQRKIGELLGDARADEQECESRFLGAMYVVEGSTLGGQYIAQHVETVLGLTAGEGDSFFRGYGKETMPKWREFQKALAELPDDQADLAISSAKGMFGIFRDWMAAGGFGAGEMRSHGKAASEADPSIIETSHAN